MIVLPEDSDNNPGERSPLKSPVGNNPNVILAENQPPPPYDATTQGSSASANLANPYGIDFHTITLRVPHPDSAHRRALKRFFIALAIAVAVTMLASALITSMDMRLHGRKTPRKPRRDWDRRPYGRSSPNNHYSSPHDKRILPIRYPFPPTAAVFSEDSEGATQLKSLD